MIIHLGRILIDILCVVSILWFGDPQTAPIYASLATIGSAVQFYTWTEDRYSPVYIHLSEYFPNLIIQEPNPVGGKSFSLLNALVEHDPHPHLGAIVYYSAPVRTLPFFQPPPEPFPEPPRAPDHIHLHVTPDPIYAPNGLFLVPAPSQQDAHGETVFNATMKELER
jgi:hypothetical protein